MINNLVRYNNMCLVRVRSVCRVTVNSFLTNTDDVNSIAQLDDIIHEYTMIHIRNFFNFSTYDY